MAVGKVDGQQVVLVDGAVLRHQLHQILRFIGIGKGEVLVGLLDSGVSNGA